MIIIYACFHNNHKNTSVDNLNYIRDFDKVPIHFTIDKSYGIRSLIYDDLESALMMSTSIFDKRVIISNKILIGYNNYDIKKSRIHFIISKEIESVSLIISNHIDYYKRKFRKMVKI